MQLEVEGFILSEIAYGESSKIINVITKEKGLIGIMCKGAKKMKSKLRFCTQLFTYGVFNIIYKENKMSTLVSGDVKNYYSAVHTDLTKLSYATYISELTLQVLKDTKDSRVFDFFIDTINKIENDFDCMVMTNILEMKYLPFLGVSINFDSCSLCGSKQNIITIDATYGGLICQNCYTNSQIVDLKIVKLLKLFAYVDIKKITNIELDDNEKDIINKFISDYYDAYTGIYTYSKKYLESLT